MKTWELNDHKSYTNSSTWFFNEISICKSMHEFMNNYIWKKEGKSSLGHDQCFIQM
jgi:hypothetical protein